MHLDVELPDKETLSKYSIFPANEKSAEYDKVDDIFNKALPSQFYRDIDLSHMSRVYDNFTNLFNDEFFDAYLNIKRILRGYRLYLESSVSGLFSDNKLHKRLNELELSSFDADALYNSTNNLIQELRSVENYLENELQMLNEI